MLVLIGGVALLFIFLEGISLAPGVGAGRLLICSLDVRSMTEACSRHLRATSCRRLQPLLVSTPLSLSDTQTPPPTKTVKSLPKKRRLSISPLLPLSWIFQSQKNLPIYAPPPPPFPLLLKDLPGTYRSAANTAVRDRVQATAPRSVVSL